jgi:hypothetical protein
MSSSSNNVVVAVEVDSQAASKTLKQLLSPDLLLNLRPENLGISEKIPGKTSVLPKDQGKNNNLSLKTSRY